MAIAAAGARGSVDVSGDNGNRATSLSHNGASQRRDQGFSTSPSGPEARLQRLVSALAWSTALCTTDPGRVGGRDADAGGEVGDAQAGAARVEPTAYRRGASGAGRLRWPGSATAAPSGPVAAPQAAARVKAALASGMAGPQHAGRGWRGGAGKRVLTKKAAATRNEDVHRQACIPPARNRAPESRVPTNRPAALAM